MGISADPPGECGRDNSSGCRTLPLIGTHGFEILAPLADHDAVLASAGAMIAEAMRHAGLNANTRWADIGEIPHVVLDPDSMVLQRDFDLFINEWRVDEIDPDYHFSLFHSSNSAAGDNAVGVNNATLDRAIDESRGALNRSSRREHVLHVQELVSDLRPVDVMFYRTRIEGYRQDRYANWTQRLGTLWNYWSLMGLHAPRVTSPCLPITMPSAAGSGERIQAVLTVCDEERLPLAGATVVLSVSHGTLEVGTAAGTSVMGTTDASGQLVFDFIAPIVEVETRVLLTATVSDPETGLHVVRSTVIRVFPLGTQFLSLDLELPLGDLVRAGADLPMTIAIRDQNRRLVTDAAVTVETSNRSRLEPDLSSGSAEEMTRVILRSTVLPTGDDVQVFVNASKSGFRTADAARIITILPEATHGDPRCPDGGCLPPDEPWTAWIPLTIFAALGSAIVVTFTLRQEPKGTRLPRRR